MTNNKQEFLDSLARQEVEFVSFRFTDLLGQWHHMSLMASSLTVDILEEGIYFDGSSLLGWKSIHESDMVMIPDLSWHVEDPFASQKTVIVFCHIHDLKTKASYNRDPRSIAQKAENFLQTTGIATQAFFGPEAEFFVFDRVRFGVQKLTSFYEIESDEFPSTNRQSLDISTHAYRPLSKGGYMPVSPLDSLCDMRAEMTSTMAMMGLTMERHHHEVSPAQHEIGFKFGTLMQTADHLQIYKYVVKNIAHSYGKTATFMPKPVYGENGSGMHVHQSLWHQNTPLFAGKGYSGLSETALYYLGGILKHAKALNVFTNPTTNSYKRLVPGYEAPVILAYSAQNRSAACRIPLSKGENSKRIEVRFPDPLANPYLSFSAMLMAGIDGIRHKIHPGNPTDLNLFENQEIAKTLPTVCGSLGEAIQALEQDYHFLIEGEVFTKDFIDTYLSYKKQEVQAYNMAPHPIEFQKLYAL